MTQLQINRLLTNKSSIGETQTDTVAYTPGAIDGEVVLGLQSFALTTNNITYAAFGDAMKYWNFFPTGRDGWGHVPVWGFAEVEHSAVTGIDVGQRYYGFFPMANHIVMQASRVSDFGFADALPHRAKLPLVYNHYTRCNTDPGYVKTLEDLQSLLRPLFITSYVLADFLADNQFFGARQAVISSASSKTAYGTAHCLKQMQPDCHLVALTSPGNMDFVRGLGCYDQVLAYDDLPQVDAKTKTAYVDFSGSDSLRDGVHMHFGANLAYDCVVGSAQVAKSFRDHSHLTPKPQFFFAPSQIAKRNQEYGTAKQTELMITAQSDFFEYITRQNPPWLTVQQHHGFEQAQDVFRQLFEGKSSPSVGHVINLAGK